MLGAVRTGHSSVGVANRVWVLRRAVWGCDSVWVLGRRVCDGVWVLASAPGSVLWAAYKCSVGSMGARA